ncbi:MAG: hypothetical protein P8K68_08790 [Algibacter sp.]|uniref:hypothetical protein n=1 Tax=Algibacter sp. TaxID=1872428 RepID=UPI0026368B1C|nr:hypothetical protein [Algibacter sp.]MDG1730390.1 hypothetical protein [Algibacter sp.]MDG2178868.1 hypothetical protein [Algibacter sp.]
METIKTYKSFTEHKSIEELQYNILTDLTSIENIKFELKFYKLLLEKPIFKSHVFNLYETLVRFKKEIKTLEENSQDLLNQLNSHAKQLRVKMECEDMVCDNFFIKTHDAIKQKTFNFKTTVFNFKFRLFQYVEGVIIN